ncbi:MAG: FAD-dependent oxidoreductase [Gammaproteobacteria bacterium]|nr:MAG: FAD-dependent oxidoreductase [Gammaproteobacteria bacterium]
MTTSPMTECIVIGGGVMGLMTAIELRWSGLTVEIYERQHIGKEASWAGGGILGSLHPLNESAANLQLIAWGQRHYPELAERLHVSTGIDPEYYPCGMWWLTEEPDTAIAMQRWARDQALSLDIMQASEISEPGKLNISDNTLILSLPQIASIRNPRLLRALHHYALQIGITIHENSPARLIAQSPSTLQVQIADQIRTANHIILTGGAWSSQILPGEVLDIRPVKGQMLIFSPESPLLEHIVVAGDHYLIPRKDGRIISGSTVEECGYDKTPSDTAASMLAEKACQLLPELETVPVEKHWAGLRPGTCRSTPYICRHPNYSNLYLNTGHYRNGFSMAPGAAHLIASLITGTSPALSPEPYTYLPEETRMLA